MEGNVIKELIVSSVIVNQASILLSQSDKAGNQSTATTQVVVPHDMRK